MASSVLFAAFVAEITVAVICSCTKEIYLVICRKNFMAQNNVFLHNNKIMSELDIYSDENVKTVRVNTKSNICIIVE